MTCLIFSLIYVTITVLKVGCREGTLIQVIWGQFSGHESRLLQPVPSGPSPWLLAGTLTVAVSWYLLCATKVINTAMLKVHISNSPRLPLLHPHPCSKCTHHRGCYLLLVSHVVLHQIACITFTIMVRTLYMSTFHSH